MMLEKAMPEVLLDVSELEPPEPLLLALEGIEQLGPGQYLRMLHRRDPCLLYGNLEDNNFNYFQRKGSTRLVELFIWRKNDREAVAAVEAITGKSDLDNR
jgi:uncharacterized protein (DUF2249 family)